MDDGKTPPSASQPATAPSGERAETGPAPDNRGKDGRFGVGNNANPGGRPKGLQSFRQSAQDASPTAVKVLQAIMLNKLVSANARVNAARTILEYAWGKPRQSIDLGGPNGEPLPGSGAPLDLLPFLRRLVKEPEPEGGASPASAPPPPIATDDAS